MYRRRNRHLQDEVQLNLAAMLDMAFQLLAFFILTFRPAPIEGHLSILLPKAGSTSTIAAASDTEQGTVAPTEFVESFLIAVTANAEGGVESLSVEPGGSVFTGDATAENLARLNSAMNEAFGSGGYEQVEILVDPRLRYDALMKIVDVCLRQQLPDGSPLQNVRFSKLRDGGQVSDAP